MPVALFGITNDGAQPDRQPAGPLPGRRLAGADRLDLLRRPAADRGPGAGRLRDRASLFPFIGTIVYTILRPPEFLEDPTSASSRSAPPSCASGSSTSSRARTAATRSSGPTCAARVPGPGQGPVRVLREADRPALGDLPLLRDPAAPGRPPPRAARLSEPRRAAEAERPGEARGAIEARRAAGGRSPSRPPAARGRRRVRSHRRQASASAASSLRAEREAQRERRPRAARPARAPTAAQPSGSARRRAAAPTASRRPRFAS